MWSCGSGSVQSVLSRDAASPSSAAPPAPLPARGRRAPEGCATCVVNCTATAGESPPWPSSIPEAPSAAVPRLSRCSTCTAPRRRDRRQWAANRDAAATSRGPPRGAASPLRGRSAALEQAGGPLEASAGREGGSLRTRVLLSGAVVTRPPHKGEAVRAARADPVAVGGVPRGGLLGRRDAEAEVGLEASAHLRRVVSERVQEGARGGTGVQGGAWGCERVRGGATWHKVVSGRRSAGRRSPQGL